MKKIKISLLLLVVSLSTSAQPLIVHDCLDKRLIAFEDSLKEYKECLAFRRKSIARLNAVSNNIDMFNKTVDSMKKEFPIKTKAKYPQTELMSRYFSDCGCGIFGPEHQTIVITASYVPPPKQIVVYQPEQLVVVHKRRQLKPIIEPKHTILVDSPKKPILIVDRYLNEKLVSHKRFDDSTITKQ